LLEDLARKEGDQTLKNRYKEYAKAILKRLKEEEINTFKSETDDKASPAAKTKKSETENKPLKETKNDSLGISPVLIAVVAVALLLLGFLLLRARKRKAR